MLSRTPSVVDLVNLSQAVFPKDAVISRDTGSCLGLFSCCGDSEISILNLDCTVEIGPSVDSYDTDEYYGYDIKKDCIVTALFIQEALQVHETRRADTYTTYTTYTVRSTRERVREENWKGRRMNDAAVAGLLLLL